MAGRGGFRPNKRLETNGDEVVVTAMLWYEARTPEERKQCRREMAQLVNQRLQLLARVGIA